MSNTPERVITACEVKDMANKDIDRSYRFRPEDGRGKQMIRDPAMIEAESMRRITEELNGTGTHWHEPELSVVRRVIHTTADFDFARSMFFSEGAVRAGREALRRGKSIVTDTNMALAGISRPSMDRYKNEAVCFMADPKTAQAARAQGSTRAWAAMGYAAEHFPGAVYVVGNAPTALIRLEELIRSGSFLPSLIIAVPVGFVNVVESKERIRSACLDRNIPIIAAMGRKGGSTVAAAIVNALFYGINAHCK